MDCAIRCFLFENLIFTSLLLPLCYPRMFEIAPDAWDLVFPFAGDRQSKEQMKENDHFRRFATRFTEMLDMAIEMLGPDLDLVEEQMKAIGVMHTSLKVMPRHYTLLGAALMEVLEETLSSQKVEFTPVQQNAWRSAYQFMSVTMMQGAFEDLVQRTQSQEVMV